MPKSVARTPFTEPQTISEISLIEHLRGNHRVCELLETDCDVCPRCGCSPSRDHKPPAEGEREEKP